MDNLRLPDMSIFENLLNQLYNVTFPDLKQIGVVNDIQETLKNIIYFYVKKIEAYGYGVAQIDDILITFVLIRLFILLFRYNFITAFAITAISIVAAYLWYSSFIGAIFNYEQALYKNSLTYRLGVDADQIASILRSEVIDDEMEPSLSNPIGILLYAFVNGSHYENHRIDIIAMTMTRLPDNLTLHVPLIGTFRPIFRYRVWGIYYWFNKKFMPMVLRMLLDFWQSVSSFGSYAYLTRVNKKNCPYLVRWHWTNIVTFEFFETYYMTTLYRISDYTTHIIYPQIMEAQKYYLRLPMVELELKFFTNFAFGMVLFHLAFILYGMFHAICGQYFYIPFFTRNIELHLGLRDKTTLYCGGHTAWQDKEEQSKLPWFIPKIWYGWFGRGTRKPSLILVFFQKFVFKPIYFIVKKILKFLGFFKRKR